MTADATKKPIPIRKNRTALRGVLFGPIAAYVKNNPIMSRAKVVKLTSVSIFTPPVIGLWDFNMRREEFQSVPREGVEPSRGVILTGF